MLHNVAKNNSSHPSYKTPYMVNIYLHGDTIT